MQWLINMLHELFGDRHRYFDRGDPAAADFTTVDFTRNNSFHDLDLSAIVPDKATLVSFRIIFKADQVGENLFFRTNGNFNSANGAIMYSLVADLYYGTQFLVHPDSNRIIEYKISSTHVTEIYVVICGWWME